MARSIPIAAPPMSSSQAPDGTLATSPAGTAPAGQADKATNGQAGKATNIVWHHSTVTRASRAHQRGHRSAILWFTGLSGAGKSTLANAVNSALSSPPRPGTWGRSCRTRRYWSANPRKPRIDSSNPSAGLGKATNYFVLPVSAPPRQRFRFDR